MLVAGFDIIGFHFYDETFDLPGKKAKMSLLRYMKNKIDSLAKSTYINKIECSIFSVHKEFGQKIHVRNL